VPYIPTTALVVRREAVDEVGVFDESLRYGEDVDLVWRLGSAGWTVRYDPSVLAHHTAPDSRLGLLSRRYRYGTSIGPLARRHGAALSGPSLAGFIAPLRLGAIRSAGVPTAAALRLTTTAPVRTAGALLKWSIPRGPGDVAYELGVLRGCVGARTLRPLLPRLRFPGSGDRAARTHDDARMTRGA
jgi:hypothetical protein